MKNIYRALKEMYSDGTKYIVVALLYFDGTDFISMSRNVF